MATPTTPERSAGRGEAAAAGPPGARRREVLVAMALTPALLTHRPSRFFLRFVRNKEQGAAENSIVWIGHL